VRSAKTGRRQQPDGNNHSCGGFEVPTKLAANSGRNFKSKTARES
jgi:hypothetical protein